MLLILSACEDKSEIKDNKLSDTASSDIKNQINNGSDSTLYASLENVIKDYTNKYKGVANWSEYAKDNKSLAVRDLKNKYLVFPLFKEQIGYLLQSDVTDTILIYQGKKSNTFVISINKGGEILKNLNDRNNGIIVIRATDIESSQKLYLVKKSTDFQHKEKKVTEFYIKAELIEADNTVIKDELLRTKFSLEE